MNPFAQIIAVSTMSLRTLPKRLGSSSVIVIGIAGAVAVLVSILAMSAGFIKSLESAGRQDRAIVVRTGASTELASRLSHDAALSIEDTPGIRRDSDGVALSSPEGLRIINVFRKDGLEAMIPVRGVTARAFAVRPEIRLLEGRMFRSGVNEMLVGKAARTLYAGFGLGGDLHIRGSDWKIVGVFGSGGDAHESELIADIDTLNSAFRRGNDFQSVTVALDSAASFEKFRDAVASNASLQVEVQRESDFYAQQTVGVNQLLSVVAYIVGSIMAIGALLGALNAMYHAVSARTREMATLRAIGFGTAGVVASVLIESLLLALLGGIIGAAVSWLAFNEHSVNTRGGALGGQTIFDLVVTPALMIFGVASACAIGLLAGLLPAVRAMRLSIASELRAT